MQREHAIVAHAHGKIAEFVEIFAGVLVHSHNDIEATIAFDDGTDRLTAEGCGNGFVHFTGVQIVFAERIAVDARFQHGHAARSFKFDFAGAGNFFKNRFYFFGCFFEQVKLPEGYVIEFGGQFEHPREARARLAVLVPTTLALIFILVFMAFRSLRQTLIIYSGVPLAATGGVFALWICGMSFSISAAVGFIALSGIAVLDGLVMLSYFNQLREEGQHVREAVIEASLTRLRPILMTAFVASFGFIPMAVATGPGAEVQRPLAIVVIGGLLTSTFLKLVLLPVLYDWAERRTRKASASVARVNLDTQVDREHIIA